MHQPFAKEVTGKECREYDDVDEFCVENKNARNLFCCREK
jgi:hypothetical protein